MPVSSAEVAEMAKLLENTFRMINIGMVNELAMMCDRLGVDVWEVIDAAATKPFGFMKFTPGPGLGGHCIPIDPLYLSWKLRSLKYTARFIELASEINTNMPRFVLRQGAGCAEQPRQTPQGQPGAGAGRGLQAGHRRPARIPGPGRDRPAGNQGRTRRYHDPYIPHLDHDEIKLDSVPDLMAAVRPPTAW